MEWQESDCTGSVHEYLTHLYVDGDPCVVVWKCRNDLGYGTGVCIQMRTNLSSPWRDLVKTPEGTTVDEARALALVLYRMGG